jgi:hypothetical protein
MYMVLEDGFKPSIAREVTAQNKEVPGTYMRGTSK